MKTRPTFFDSAGEILSTCTGNPELCSVAVEASSGIGAELCSVDVESSGVDAVSRSPAGNSISRLESRFPESLMIAPKSSSVTACATS